MTYSLCLQATYSHLDVGIFQDGNLILSAEKDKSLASKELVPLCAALLMDTGLSLNQLSYIGATQGPAPFTTLRTVITTVNALAYANTIPLVGVDGLALLFQENLSRYKATSNQPVVLLHAFGNDVYYAYEDSFKKTITGCAPLITVIEALADTGKIYVITGNAAHLHKNAIAERLQNRAIIPDMIQQYASLEALGKTAWQNWQEQKTSHQLQPLYLKKTL